MPKHNGGSNVATREEFLAAFRGNKALKREELHFEDLGLRVLVWELTGPEQVAYKQAMTDRKQRIPIGGKRKQLREMVIESTFADATLKLVAWSLKDPNGRVQYTPDEIIEANIPASVFDRIVRKALELSRLDDEDLEEGKEPSEPIRTGSDATTSPSPSGSEPQKSSSLS